MGMRVKSKIKRRVQKLTNNKKQTVIIFIALIGIATLMVSQAAVYTVSLEVENGTIAGNAAKVSDASASGGSAISFAGSGPSSWPSPDSHKVCGNTSILNGPTTAPAGAVTVNPGTDLAALTNSSPAGTTFYLKAGTHTLPSAPINPRTGNKYIGAPGAVLDGQFKTNYTYVTSTRTRIMSMAFKGSSGNPDVVIQYLTIKNFGQVDGKMKDMVNQTAINWGQSPGWTISNNTISYNGGSGVWTADNSKLQNNCIEYNEQMGFAVPSVGGEIYNQRVNVLVEGNEIRYNNRSNAIETLGECTGCAGGLKIWNSKGVTIRNNNVNNNYGTGIWVDNNNIDVLVEGNVSKDNAKRGIFYEISYGGIIRKNYVTGNYVDGKGSSHNNTAIYISESGGDEATKTYLGGTFPAELDINNNYIVDNWNGITLWEDAGRYCTKNDTPWCPSLIQGKNVTEKNANITKCSTNLASNADICRWKTKNVKVHNNRFEMTSAASAWCAITNTGCAKVAIWANAGPAGTPYAGNTVIDNISKNQNNKFYNNIYIGKWNYYIPSTSVVTRESWQSVWGQDTGSTF